MWRVREVCTFAINLFLPQSPGKPVGKLSKQLLTKSRPSKQLSMQKSARAACLHEEVAAAVHPYMTRSQAAVLVIKHTVHRVPQQHSSKVSSSEEGSDDDSSSEAEGRWSWQGEQQGNQEEGNDDFQRGQSFEDSPLSFKCAAITVYARRQKLLDLGCALLLLLEEKLLFGCANLWGKKLWLPCAHLRLCLKVKVSGALLPPLLL